MLEIPRSRRSPHLLGVGGLVLILGALPSPGCNCGVGGTSARTCSEAEPDCPLPLVCDTARGLCVDRLCGDGLPACPGSSTCDPAAGVCVPLCDPPAPGCPCVPGTPQISCMPPGIDPALEGWCRRGLSDCAGESYGECVVVADPMCESVSVGAGAFSITPENSEQVQEGPEGELVLDPSENQVDFGFLWIANTGENTVSKIDVETGHEVARYASVKGSASIGVPAVPIGGYGGDPSDCGNCPSRTAIDFHGNAFVANRAFGLQASVTKFANAEEDCLDADADGVETSRDANGDGRINVDDPTEFLGESDECILWTVPVGGNNGVARALAIDAGGPDGEDGNIWVGLYAEHRVVALSGRDGSPLVGPSGSAISVNLQDGGGTLHPYGAAVDGANNVWVTGIEDGAYVYLAKINAFSGELAGFFPAPDDDDGCSTSYGIAVDTSQRVWLGGWECRNIKAFDSMTETWYRREIDDRSATRGIAIDLNGNVWTAHTNGQVSVYRAADVVTMNDGAPQVALYTVPALPGGSVDNTIGVGIDRNGACWAVSRNDAASGAGSATRIKPDGTMQAFPVGRYPYTYSDFTGFGLLTVVRPNGWWRGVIEGCAAEDAVSDWTTLTWSEVEPPGTTIRLRVRAAATIPELAGAWWYGPWDAPPVDLHAAGVPDARYMQIEVQLSSTDPDVSPTFNGFTVEFDCPNAGPQ